MRKIKNIVSLILIILLFSTNIFNVFSYSKNTIPYYIKIGLFFDKTAKSTLLLESDTAFEVGFFDEDEFISLFDLNKNKVLLKKDKPYIKDLSSNGSNNILDIEGFYYVQIGDNFTSYDEAQDFLNSINIEHVQIYPYYEDGWKVYTGPYINKFNAKEEANKISKDYNFETNIINPLNTRVQVLDEKDNIIFIYDSSDEIYFAGKYDGNNIPLVKVGETSYRGGITAKRLSNSDMTIINKLPLEEYLYGVVPSEMPAYWPIEALKAQAIAARGFAITNLNKYSKFDFNLCTTTYSQVYKGYSGEHPNTNKAVDETKNIVITYNGKLVEPYYHSDSGGYTEDSENVWTNPLPYIRGIEDKFSSDTPYSNWSISFTNEEIKNRLANNNIFIGDILDIKVTSVSNNGRVLSLTVYGTEGEETLEKEKSRLVFGLKSNLFKVNSNNDDNINNNDDNNNNNKDDYIKLSILGGTNSKPQSINLKGKYIINSEGVSEIKNIEEILIYDGKQYKNINKKELIDKSIKEPIKESIKDTRFPNEYIFDGKGYGHGLGMSQYGAKKMAQLNYKYDEILTHYYTGVKVE